MSNNGANLGFEEKLWSSADKLRSNMDAAEYKHVVLGLIFLKYISDAFTEVYEKLKKRTFHMKHNEEMNYNCKQCNVKISAHNKDWHANLCDKCFDKMVDEK